MKKNKGEKGFGLISVMIVLSVVVFVADITYPSIKELIDDSNSAYNAEVKRESEAISDAKAYLTAVQNTMNLSYLGDGSYYSASLTLNDNKVKLPNPGSWFEVKNNSVSSASLEFTCEQAAVVVNYNGTSYSIQNSNVSKKP